MAVPNDDDLSVSQLRSWRLKNEILMLIDFITRRNNKTINDINITHPDKTVGVVPLAQCLTSINLICDKDKGADFTPDEVALLQITRDALVTKCDPASPQSIAYSNLYLSKLKGRVRSGYAAEAFPRFVNIAFGHRIINYCIMVIALALAAGAIYKSVEATHGKYLIDARQELRIQQAAIRAEQLKVDAKDNNHTQWRHIPLLQASIATKDNPQPLTLNFDLCQRAHVLASILAPRTPDLTPTATLPIPTGFQWPVETINQHNQTPHSYFGTTTNPSSRGDVSKGEKLVPIYENPLQADVCNRDLELAAKFHASSIAMGNYIESWNSYLLSPFPANGIRGSLCNVALPQGCCNGQNSNCLAISDLEFKIAPTLLVIGNILLPTVFAFLGAAAFVVVDLYRKLQTSTLTPDERMLCIIRLVLGGIVGICISLFFSGEAPASVAGAGGAPPDLLASMKLTTSFVAFLAGFGADGVFNALRTLVNRVFPSVPTT